MAAPAMAVRMRAGVVGLAALVSLAGFVYGQSQPESCQPALPSLQSDKGATFTANAYGIVKWHTSSNGRRLPYAVHVWKGKSGDRPAYLTFDEIPGTSGPNYHLDRKLKGIPAKIDWTANRDFAFDPRVIIRSGPLKGEWTVTNCPTR
jgi:hypothetical protein